jgi:hypothetical protein
MILTADSAEGLGVTTGRQEGREPSVDKTPDKPAHYVLPAQNTGTLLNKGYL